MTFDALNRGAIVATTALLTVGLGVWIARGPAAADRLLDAGLIALMLTPVLRLGTTFADDVRRRDTTAVLTTVAVFLILVLALLLAVWR